MISVLWMMSAADSGVSFHWRPDGAGGGELRYRSRALFDVRAEAAGPAAPWTVSNGRLLLANRSYTDRFVIHQSPVDSRRASYEADITVVEGDVAGIVFQASGSGAPCFAVLLSAQSRSVRIVYLPWPGNDLKTAPAPVERARKHMLRVDVESAPTGTKIEVLLDGSAVTTHFESRFKSDGKRCGLLTNNSVAEVHRLAAYAGTSITERKLIVKDDFHRSAPADYGLHNVKLPAHWTEGSLAFETTLPANGSGYGAIAEITHSMNSLRHLWIPHVSPSEDTVIGDHSFRSPAIVLADARQAIALVPDIDDLADAHRQGQRVWIDYDHPSKRIRVAYGDYAVGKFHVDYQPTSLAYSGQKVRIGLHVLASSKKQDLANPYGMVARWVWGKWGHSGYERGGSQRAPLTVYSRYVVNWAFEAEPKGWGDTVWQEFSIDGKKCGAPAFIVDVAQHPSVPVDKRRWREQRSVWNQAWFSTQRTANGLLRYARRTGSRELERRARLMTQVTLCAPQTDGLFPAVYTAGGGGYRLYRETPGWENGRWSNSDRRPPGVSEKAVHILDAAFTCRLLLEWQDLNPKGVEALPYVRRFADRLCRLQQENGSFPGWVEPDGSIPGALAAGPESAMSATLLLDLARRYPEVSVYRGAARKALAFLENGPVREGRWEDFETYFSCSRWGADRIGQIIPRNGVYKSNTFSPFWCAEAFLAASRTLNNKRYIDIGRRCLDELSLYQQVWEPPLIPAPTHGGFGVMNADGEWNDARQSLFAPLYLEYYRDTGHAEYFERGVSALRASFAMMYCPENRQVKSAYERQHPFFGPESYGFMMENIAHGGPGPDPIGPFTIFTWGNGAALEAAARLYDLYGDVYLDRTRKRAFGVDGFSAALKGDTLTIRDPYRRGTVDIVSSEGIRHRISTMDGIAEVKLREIQ